MSSNRKQNSSNVQKSSYICTGKLVSDIVGGYFHNSSDSLLLQKIRSQLDRKRCDVRNILCLRLDEETVRFVVCGRQSRKISSPSNLSQFLKTQASELCDSQDPFDQLLVNAMWAKAIAESNRYHCDIDDVNYRYYSFESGKVDGSYSVVFSYRSPLDDARNSWVDVNCPQNMLALYSSGGVPIKGGTVERDLPSVAGRLELQKDYGPELQ